MCDVQGDSVFTAFRDELVGAGLLIPLGVPGLFGRSGEFESILDGFEAFITRSGAHQKAEVMRFPPLFSRLHYEQTGHIGNFPDLLGAVHGFTGNERDHASMQDTLQCGEDWGTHLNSTNLMLVPAACYPLYPAMAGTLPEGGRVIDLKTPVFRREPSDNPTRLQCFVTREFVRLGTPEQALSHRDYWMDKGVDMLCSVGLDAGAAVANDPFFGRGGRVMKDAQREQNLKYELVVPIFGSESPTAVGSSNLHLDHFGDTFGIRTADGQTAHSACVGFGLERIALALLKKHGTATARWPHEVRQVLAMD
jgi:seryl-tRNA synthetase